MQKYFISGIDIAIPLVIQLLRGWLPRGFFCVASSIYAKGTYPMQTLKKVFSGWFCEAGSASLTKLLTLLYFLLFAFVSVYLVVHDRTWGSYEVFAAIAGGSGVAAQMGNKLINSKYNTIPGSFESATRDSGK